MSQSFWYCRSKLALAIFFTLLFALQSLFAQGVGSISGRVFDQETGNPLAYANVIVVNTNIGIASDLEGRFILRDVPIGNITIRVSYIGYVPVTQEITVEAGAVIQQDFRLTAQALEGETVVVTGQAQGQISAINQQLASNTIANIVSQSRIKELPDVNAAESIGRLPGISIQRSGGEATRIEIRGLSPKYNTVTVNGVLVPATGGDDRSVDLSLISSNMLDGIEVKKANTPDMDADALGGTVDLRLKEAPEGIQVSFSGQGGYNRLQDYYGNYNFTGNVSNRFFDGALGAIATFNLDDYDRSADKFQGNYRSTGGAAGATGVDVQSILLREELVKRGRTGASLLLDYRIPYGKVTANSFYNRLSWEGLYRINRMNVNDLRHYYDIEDRSGTTSIFTGALGMEQDYDWIRFDVSFARTASRSDNPNDMTWTFAQENAAFKPVPSGTLPDSIPSFTTPDSTNSGLAGLYIYDTKRDENQTSVQLNIKMPFRLGDLLNGYLKFGGKLRWLDRKNDENQYGRDGLQYGSTTALSTPMSVLLKSMSDMYPNDFNFMEDSLLVRQYGVYPISRFLSNYSRSDFLDGDYPLGYSSSESLLRKMTNAYRTTAEWLRYAIGSRGRDYDGVERYQAGYIMSEFNFFDFVTVLPGIRWEKDYSKYHGQSYRENVVSNIQREPTDFREIENVRENQFWLPMVHLRVKPADWANIRLAWTNTLTRPDYIQYAPISSINSYQNYSRAANALLKPARSKNYDAAISIYQNYVGLFSASGFYKTIDDLILQTTIYYQPGVILPEGLNIPNSWLEGASPQIDTYMNNPRPATYKGFELEWQTHFWYLPSVLKGLVLNVNYTRIYSEIEKQLFFVADGDVIPGTRPPRRYKVLVDSLRTARMPDQPGHIANITLGYDIEGFSARVSYLYQTDKTTFLSLNPTQDSFAGEYARWDLSLQQRVTENIQMFANFNNLNNRADKNFRGNQLINPTYIEYYGFAADVGVRLRL